jgi:S-(hydroxymethyl)glutathione dehydrogenase/alcohol dehydrogenase
MTVTAAVLRESNKPLEVEEIDLLPLASDQVRVQISASGVCHSDLSMQNGALPFPRPAVLGHEGAGIVEEVGADVTHVAPGDHVVISWSPSCGECWFCLAGELHLCERAIMDTLSMPYAKGKDGRPLYSAMGVGSFATASNCLGRALIKIDPSIPLDIAALIGCAVSTGAGAAMNTAPVTPGSSVAIIGMGGVGLSAQLGALVQGAETVIAIDTVESRRASALSLGATHAIDPLAGDPVEAVKALTGGRGADFVFEVVGRSATILMAHQATRRGGTTCIVGAARPDDMVELSSFLLFFEAKSLVGCQAGSTVPARDFPLLLELWKGGQMPLDQLVTRRISLDQVNEAFDDLTTGTGIRTVIVN